jgi:acetyl esterase
MSLQRTITRALLKLPDGVLVKMSGRTPEILDGRKLDARFQFIGAAAAKQTPKGPITPLLARAGTDQLTFLFGGRCEPDVQVTDITIPSPAYAIPARIYRSGNQRPQAPLLVFAHFGGGVVGNLETCHAFCSILATGIGCPVLSVDYRLAPEHPWPQGLNDVLAAFEWGRAHADQFGAPAGLAAIGGDSMGGNFAAVIAQDMKRAGKPQPFLQVLIYPATSLTATGGSMETFTHSFPLTRQTLEFFVANYLPPGTDPQEVRVSPAHADSLAGLAPAFVATAGHDPLCDQGRDYAEALEAAGVNAHYICYDSMAHGFTAFTGAIPAADKACRDMAHAIGKAYRAMGG